MSLFAGGDRVVVRSGPMSGLTGVVVRADPADGRLAVRLVIFGREVTAEFTPDELRPAGT